MHGFHIGLWGEGEGVSGGGGVSGGRGKGGVVNSLNKLHINRPIRLIQCCTQFKSPGDKILCVLYLHYNVAFTFK